MPIEIGETEENLAFKLLNPSVSFLMVNMARGIARGRLLFLEAAATTTSRKHGELSHTGLVNIKSHKS